MADRRSEPHRPSNQKIGRRLGIGRVDCDEAKRANAVHQHILGKRRALRFEGRIGKIVLHADFNGDARVAVVPYELDALLARDFIQRSLDVVNPDCGADRAEEESVAARLRRLLLEDR